MREIVLTLGRSSSKALNATCIDGPPTPRWQSGADPARIRVSLTTAFVNDGLLEREDEGLAASCGGSGERPR